MDDPGTPGVTEGFGLMFYRSRWYDPLLSRFAQADTLVPGMGDAQALDRYAYSINNPVKYTDPSGHAVTCMNDDLSKGCAGTGLGGLTPGQILNSDAPEEIKDRAIYNYSITHPYYNYELDIKLEDTTKFIVANAIFIGDADSLYRLPGLSNRIKNSWKTFASGFGLFVATIIAGGGSNSDDHDTPSIGKQSTGRITPLNLKEQLAMQEVMADPGKGIVLRVTMTDPRWPASDGWVKMAQNINGIHYVRNTLTGQVADFKFK